jgi:hypothetical protein
MEPAQGQSPYFRAVSTRHGKAVEPFEQMLDPSAGSGQALHKQLPKAKTPHEQESLQRQIAATDKQIDTLVFDLYGLSIVEVRTVEGHRT